MKVQEYSEKDVERFVAKVMFPSEAEGDEAGCWLWQGAKHGQERGYGKIRLGGRVISAHRAAYLLFVGPIEDGLVIGHLCNRESCCNPAHLRAESQSSNMKYCVSCGRHNSQRGG